MACRRIARELVERWSRPIFDQYREHDSEALKEQYNEELAKARQRRQLKEAKAAAALSAGLPFYHSHYRFTDAMCSASRGTMRQSCHAVSLMSDNNLTC